MIIRANMILRQLFELPSAYENWWLAVLDHLKILQLLGVKTVVYRLRTGEKMYARPSQFDIGIIHEVFHYKVYDKPEYDINVRTTDTVLDVGGYIGDFTIFAAMRAERGVVYVFEPSQSNYTMVLRNIELNKLENVSPHNAAISGMTGNGVFFINEKAEGSNTLYRGKANGKRPRKVTVKVLGINDFVKSNAIKKMDFIKLDCEGSEYDILYTIDPNLLKKTRCIVLEFHDIPNKDQKKYSKIALIKHLTRLGFTVHHNPNELKIGTLYCRRKT